MTSGMFMLKYYLFMLSVLVGVEHAQPSLALRVLPCCCIIPSQRSTLLTFCMYSRQDQRKMLLTFCMYSHQRSEKYAPYFCICITQNIREARSGTRDYEGALSRPKPPSLLTCSRFSRRELGSGIARELNGYGTLLLIYLFIHLFIYSFICFLIIYFYSEIFLIRTQERCKETLPSFHPLHPLSSFQYLSRCTGILGFYPPLRILQDLASNNQLLSPAPKIKSNQTNVIKKTTRPNEYSSPSPKFFLSLSLSCGIPSQGIRMVCSPIPRAPIRKSDSRVLVI